MNDKQKQIDEMVKVIMDAVPETIQYVQAPANETEARIEAKALYAVGYRKQSDTVREFVEQLYKQTHNYYPSIDHYCLSKRVILVKDLEELVAEYGMEVNMIEQKRIFTEEQKATLQNALRKCSLIRYLARDKNGALWGYSHKPKRTRDGWICSDSGTHIYLGSLTTDFPQITWEDEEPTGCEEILGGVGLIEEMAQAMSDFKLEDTANCDMELSRHLIAKGYRKQCDTVKEFVEQLKELLHKHEYRNQTDGVSFYQMNAESFCDEINDLAAQYGVEVEE